MEEIIIDGVNVKDCKRRFGKNSYCRYFKRPCAENNFNCIWKQYERLKAENERLKFKLETVEADYEASEIEIEDLKNEVNFLRTANDHLLQLDYYRQKELETKAEEE